mmetsp:Transcript_17652/g.38511  ORF Transcript_17652/g.38511 Transcript_17652/m.38511 type:complete len:303 (+) Transcript_17652:209-1117(+)
MGDGRAVRRISQVPILYVVGLSLFSFTVGYVSSRRMEKPTTHAPDIRVYAEHQVLLDGNEQALKPSSITADGVEHGGDGEDNIDEIRSQVLSWHPRAVSYPGFATPEQCQKFIDLAKPKLRPSGLALRKGDTAEGTKNIRTSHGTFLSRNEDPSGLLHEVEKKIARVTMIPWQHGEPFNVLRYQLGQKYDSHYDTFDPKSYGDQPSQRLATFLLYLTDVEEGGETIFPFEGQDGMKHLATIDYTSCDVGFKVKPRAGDGLLFYSIHPNSTFDNHALHGGCPVVTGDKWVATKWMRDKRFGRQ